MEESKEVVLHTAVMDMPKITQKEIDDFLFASGTKLTDQQKAMFFQMAHINNLNPFRREIYAIAYGDRFNIITGYEVYLKRAERTGLLDGWEADYKTDPNGDYAFCTINRKDWSKPLTQKVWLSEFNLKNKIWNEKPKTMLIKVAIATAFRRAFPEEVGGLPYTSDEIPLEGEVIKSLPEPSGAKNIPQKQAPSPEPETLPEPETFDVFMARKISEQKNAQKAKESLDGYCKYLSESNCILVEEVKQQTTDYAEFWDQFISYAKAKAKEGK